MPANLNSGLSLDEFENEIQRMFGGTKLTMRFDQIEESILRVGFRARGMPELVVDLRAGPKTRWGQTIFEVTSKGKKHQMYFYGAEAIGGEAPKEVTFRDAEKSFVNYITGAFREELRGTFGMTPKERLSFLRTFGYYPEAGEATKYFAAGGVMNINPTLHWGKQLTDLLEGITVRAREKYMINQTITDLWEMGAGIRREMAVNKAIYRMGTLQRQLAEIPGFMQAPTAGETGRLVPIPGVLEFDEYGQAIIKGIGPAATIAKREPLYQREPNVHFIMQTPEGQIKISEPGYITQREAAGWRYPNLKVAGVEPAPIYYQPRVLQIPGIASGAMLLRREAWEGYQAAEQERWMQKPEGERVIDGVLQRNRVIAAGYTKGLKVEFPEVSVRELTKLQIIPGFFKRAGAGEYERIADYTERAIPAYQTQIVGLLKYHERGKEITREITATAGATPFYIPEGEEFGLNLYMPEYYSPYTGEAVQFKGKTGRSTIEYANRLLADAKAPGLNITRTSGGQITMELVGMMGVAPSMKGPAGTKIVIAPQPQAAHTPALGLEIGGKTEQYWAVTSDVKLATEWFTWSVFAGLPNAQQEQMLRELQYADPSKERAVNAMIGYMRHLPLTGGATRIPDLDMLAKIYSKTTHRPAVMAGFELMEELRQRVMSMDPATSMARYQMALLPAEWRQVGEHDISERGFLETKYRAAFGDDWQKYVRLDPIKGKKTQIMESVFAWSVLGPVGSTLTAEYMSQDPRVNLAGLRSIPEDIARQLEIAPGMDVSGTGMAPRATRAWKGVVDAISWWKSKMATPPDYTLVNKKYGEPFEVVTLEELRLAGIRSEIGPRSTPRQISKIITEKLGREPEMLLLPDNQIFPLPRLIDPLATYHYGMEEGVEEAISRMGRTYSRALIDAMTYGTVSSLSPMKNAGAKWLEDVNKIVESGKEVYKLTTGATTEAMIGGRYVYTQGVPFNVGVVEEATFQAALERKAAKLGIENRAEWMDLIHKQMRRMGGIPSLTIREPNVWEKYGAVPSMLVTPSLMKEKYGLEFPEGTQVQGFRNQQIIGGNPFLTGIVGALGYMTVGQQGDWDMDQMLAVMGIRITKKGIVATKKLLQLATQKPEDLINFVNASGRETLGYKVNEFGVEETAFDVVVKQLRDIREGLLPGMKWETTPQGDRIQVPTSPEITYGSAVQEESRLRALSKQGMAVAHIQRTWLTAGAIAMGMSQERVQQAITGTANPYQSYLDYMTKEIKARGGFTAVEELFSTSVFSYDEQTKVLSIYGMHRGDKGFAKIASSYGALDMKGKPMMQGTFYLGVTEALVWALQESGYTNKSLSFLLAQTPEMQEEIYNRLQKGTKLSSIMLPGTSGNIWSRGEYDITKTPIGLSYMSDIIRRNVRPGHEKTLTVGTDAQGNEIKLPIQQVAAHQPFFWQGKTVAFGDLIKDPAYLATSIMVQALTNQGGSLAPEQAAVIIQLQTALEKQGIKVPAAVRQVAARYPVGESYAEAITKQATADETLNKLVQQAILGIHGKGKMTVRASAVPYYAIENYEQAGNVYGPKGAKMWEKVSKETRLKLFMERVMGIERSQMNLIFPMDAKSQRIIEQGWAFEEEYVGENIGDWGKYTVTGIKTRTDKDIVHAEISMRQLAGYAPVANIFQALIAEIPDIENWAITGIPDIMRISESGEAIIEEVKQIGNYGARPGETDVMRKERESLLRRTKAMSDQVRIQTAAYLLGGLATAAAGSKAFKAWITPLIEGSEEFQNLRYEERGAWLKNVTTRMYKAFRSGGQAIETIGVRGVKGAEPISAITLDELQGLGMMVSEGMRKAYREWTDPASVKQLYMDAITAIRDSGVDVAPQLQKLIDELPLEPRVAEEPDRMDIKARVKPAKKKEVPDVETLADQIRKDPIVAIEAYFKTRPTSFGQAQGLVESAVAQVGKLQEQGVLDLPMKMYRLLMKGRGIDVSELPEDTRFIDVIKGATPQELSKILGMEKDILKQAAKASGDVQSAVQRAGIHSNIQGMEQLTKIVNMTSPSLAPGQQYGMGETLQIAKELQPFIASINALGKNFNELSKETVAAREQIAQLGDEIGAISKQAVEAPYGSPEQAKLLAQKTVKEAQIARTGARLERLEIARFQAAIAETGQTEDYATELLAATDMDKSAITKERAAQRMEDQANKELGVTAKQATQMGKLSRVFRNFIGGWGIFYMSTLASWPARAMAYGLEEQEAMGAGMAAQIGGQLGVGAAQPYQQVAFDVMRSKMVSNAGGMAYSQWLGSQMPGFMRQMGGVGMGTAAGAAFATFGLQAIGPVMGEEWTQKWGGKLTMAGMVIGALGSTALNIAGNIRAPNQAALSAAADWERYGGAAGAVSWAWNVGLPEFVRSVGQPQKLGTGQAWGMNVLAAPDALRAMKDEFLTGVTSTNATANMERSLNKYSQGNLYQTQLPAIAALVAQDPQFASYDPNIVSSAAIRVYASGKGFGGNTAELIKNIVKAESIGIPTQQLGMMYTETFRERYTAETGGAAEQWAATRVANVYDAAESQAAMQFLGQAPVSYIKRTLGGGARDWKQRAIDAAKSLRLTPEGRMWEEAGNQAAIAEMMGQEYFTPATSIPAGVNAASFRQEQYRQYRQQVSANSIAVAAYDAGISGNQITKLVSDVRNGGPIETIRATRAITASNNIASLGIDPSQYDLYATATTAQGAYLNQLQTNVSSFVQQQLGDQIGANVFTEWTKPGGPLATVRDAQMTSQAFQQNPFRLTDIAMAQPINATSMAFSMKYATGDISGRTGRQTGLAWGTSGLQRGNIPAFQMGARIWGYPSKERPWGQVAAAMTTGYEAPSGEMLYGEQAYQQLQSDLGFQYQMEGIGFQERGIALQKEYIPQFRAIQTQQMQAQYATTMRGFQLSLAGVGVQFAQIQLGHRQFQEQMALQLEQFGLQGRQFGEQQALQRQQFFGGQALQRTQFQEQIALQQRQTIMQRGWTQQDWAFQGQVREMQWGWRQQDFQESARFMTGRERRLAERQMERETTMHTMEGEQIEKQKARQKEVWKLEDERFALQKKQFSEQLEFAKKNFLEQQELQKRHYDQQRELQIKSFEMQKRHEEERYKLSLAAAGVQAAQIKNAMEGYQTQHELQIKLRDLQWEYEDKQRQLQEDQLEWQKQYIIDQKAREDEYLTFAREQAKIAGETSLALSDIASFTNDLQNAISTITGYIQNLQDKVNNFSWGKIWSFIQTLLGLGLANSGDGGQTGLMFTVPPGYMNDNYTVRASTGETVMVIPTDKGIRPTQNWNNVVGNMFTYPSSNFSGFSGGGSPGVIIINIGNERLGKYVIGHVNQELEV